MDMTLADLVRYLHGVKQKRSDLAAEDKELKLAEEGIEIQIMQAMPPGSDKVSFTVDDAGTQRTVTRSNKTRFVTAEGQADLFYGWVKATGNVEFLNRTVKQSEVESYQAEHRSLPPGITVFEEPVLKSTVTRKPPTN